MTTEALTAALAKAKNLHDHGRFGTLEQAEFFKAMDAGLAEPDPPADEEYEAPAKSKAKETKAKATKD